MEKYPINNRTRQISPTIFKKYDYTKDSDGNHLITLYDNEGRSVGYKKRFRDNTFDFGDYKFGAVPFGLNLFRSGGKQITITESEIDCLSISEAFDGKWPVISLNHGLENAKEQLIPHMEKINTFEKINLWFKNNDKNNIEKEIASLFPPGKTHIIKDNTFKDANEALQSGKNVLKNIFYEAKQITPIGIVNANEGGFEAFMEDDTADEVYDTLYNNLEVSKGAITTFVSGTGMGKTTAVKEISYDLLMRHKLKIGYVGLEEANKVSKRGFIGIHLDTPLMKKNTWANYKEDEENYPDLRIAYDEVIEPGNLLLFNHFGSMDSDILIDKLRFLAAGAKCDFIILDHISIVVSGQESSNDVKVIDILMTKLRSLVEETGVGMLLISHLKRIEGNKGHEDGATVSLSHLRGSGAIAQISDSVIGLEGNQQSEDESNIRTFRMLKMRDGGETGIMGQAKYNKHTGRLLPYEEIGFENEKEK